MSFEYLTYHITKSDIFPLTSKVEARQQFKTFERSILGLVNHNCDI
jgi:hypothetical protein